MRFRIWPLPNSGPCAVLVAGGTYRYHASMVVACTKYISSCWKGTEEGGTTYPGQDPLNFSSSAHVFQAHHQKGMFDPSGMVIWFSLRHTSEGLLGVGLHVCGHPQALVRCQCLEEDCEIPPPNQSEHHKKKTDSTHTSSKPPGSH